MCRGWQEALLPHPVWKCDLLYIFKTVWRQGGIDIICFYFGIVEVYAVRYVRKVTSCGPELQSRDKVLWWTEDWLEIKRPQALSEHHRTADRQPIELSSRAHRQQSLCRRPILNAWTDKCCTHYFHSSLCSVGTDIFYIPHTITQVQVLLLLSKNNLKS